TWTVAGVGRSQLPLTTMAILMGGHVRVGFEDNIYLSKGVKAESNADFVERIVRIAGELNREVATPEEARLLKGIRWGLAQSDCGQLISDFQLEVVKDKRGCFIGSTRHLAVAHNPFVFVWKFIGCFQGFKLCANLFYDSRKSALIAKWQYAEYELGTDCIHRPEWMEY
ncbi:3-keto-5-aminohexanoate cleavage enzyme like protein, partial [Aduncisulcus paluster]